VLLWAIQTQLLTQIIANRVSLIMTDRRKSRQLKWALAVSTTIVNISVFCIWIPAHMPGANDTIITLNNAWERVEKGFFLLLDLSLNLIFLYLVRSRLISGGLSKYWRLYNFNAGIVVVSTCMDILLLGFLSLPNQYVYVAPDTFDVLVHIVTMCPNGPSYVQFAPVAYIIKLNIELTMAVLISKVVRSSGNDGRDGYSSSHHFSGLRTHQGTRTVNSNHDRDLPGAMKMNTLVSGPTLNGSADEHEHQGPGIMRTVVTSVKMEDDDGSTEELVANPKRLTK